MPFARGSRPAQLGQSGGIEENIYIPLREKLNVDTDVVIEGPLNLNVKLSSYICDRLANFCVAWGVKDAIVHVDN